MQKKRQIKGIIAARWGIAALALGFTGCATTVAFQVQHLPALNTLGIQRLAVMPFSTTDNSSLQRQAATWLTSESLTRIQATNHFTLVNASEIERVRAARGNTQDLADAFFGGQVISAVVQNSSSQSTGKDKDGNTFVYTTYNREVQLVFNYSITRTRDGSMIGPETRTLSTSSSSRDDPSALSSVDSMMLRLVQRGMTGLGREIAPYITTENRSLMKETSKDKVIKQRAKDAEALVKAGNYRNAQNVFMGIYQDTRSFAAAYNVALLIEVQGELEEATAFMQRVYKDTGNPKAASEIARLQKAIADAGLFEAYIANQSQRDRVIALMVDTLPSRIPNEPRIALVNNSRNERELAESIINGIIEGFVSKNITVIDRNSRTLMEMERNYQLSGNVSDDEMVKIGHEAGINAFVLVAVTGSGSSRRLSVRMLDVERSTILYQSPQTDEMNL
ncbi:MAG: hypothetical protein LBQ69_02195 [Treponema sp.]|jgi:TolB-like protein|nr:hypothetical protein [Treponema sp.]